MLSSQLRPEVGVEAVEKLRDAAEELEVKNPAPE